MRKFIKEELEKVQDSAHNFNLQDQQALYGKPQPCIRMIDAFNVCLKAIDRDRANRAETLVIQKPAGDKFNVICYTEYDPNDEELYTHWAKGLTMLISKNGQAIKLNEEEIQELIKCLPKTVGGKY